MSREVSGPSNVEQGDSSDENETTDLSNKRLKSPSRRDSYSDSSRSADEEATDLPTQVCPGWNSALYQTSGEAVTHAHGQHEAHSGQEEAVCTVLCSDQEAPSKLEDRYAVYSYSLNVAEGVYKNFYFDQFIKIHFCLDFRSSRSQYWFICSFMGDSHVVQADPCFFCLFVHSGLPLDLPLIPTCRTIPDVPTSVLINDCYATPASELTPHLGGTNSLLGELEKNAEEYEPVICYLCLSVA